MAGRLNMAFFAVILIAALLRGSAAQRTHVVGDGLGWIIPPSSSAYSTWASNQSFSVGDILVFNFVTGAHDVAKVAQADYDACSTTNPIQLVATSPARITIDATGEHYFICNFTGHCTGGQRLMINVSTAASPAPQPSSPAPQLSSPAPQLSSPAPQPSSPQVSAPTPAPVSSPPPTPVSAPSPAPSRSPVTYTVGDTFGWFVPGNNSFYRNWASNKTFNVGDILVFNYLNGAHNVAEVTRESYGSCNVNSPVSLSTAPPTRITLNTPGEHFYICAVPGHCNGGQQLAINVTGTATSTPPSPTPTASPPTTSTTPALPNTPSSPSPTGSAVPPPPESSATSLGIAGLSATFVSILVALLY